MRTRLSHLKTTVTTPISHRRTAANERALVIGVGTVSGTADRSPGAAVAVDVETVSGERFRGALTTSTCHGTPLDLRPGVVVAVRFDPDRPTDLALADDMIAARAAFDHMLIRKGLTTTEKIDLVRRGNRSQGVVTAMRVTGAVIEDHREITVDLMVSKTDGGQFASRETAFIPATSVNAVTPGSVVAVYYRTADESTIAITVAKA
ncbi:MULTISPECIES: hypothetical protein [Mycobacteriales]|uniref:DUF5666 domain-containing protein n=1 Tax=Gordonia rubripertincta TaxID=36822 RepID=A0ABT4N297_GORRU|nr:MULTISPECIES: hypothetical protein [Mycobacteriales]MCZ4553398.1 hypothetical protein [Gordonia rubripertincta]